MERERIGIMGGSFNPIHERHVEMAQCAKKEYKLDRVIFLPTGNSRSLHLYFLFAFLVLLMTYVGTNTLLPGLHTYA